MPEVDLETLMDNKIACETTADFPPESFWLSKDAEFDWFSHNAFYERNESGKGKSITNPVLESSSRRYSTNVKPKPSIIGLPKTQKTNYNDHKNRKKNTKRPRNVKLFPKRTGSMSKPANQLNEPSSPNVSCMGRVKSKRKNRKRVEPEKVSSKGICKQFFSMFRSKKGVKGCEPVSEPVKWKVNSVATVRTGNECGEPAEPPGLGAMKRFASGRKSSSSSADVAEVVG